MSRFRYVILPRLLLALSTLALLAALFVLWVTLERPMPTIALACRQAGPANGFSNGEVIVSGPVDLVEREADADAWAVLRSGDRYAVAELDRTAAVLWTVSSFLCIDPSQQSTGALMPLSVSSTIFTKDNGAFWEDDYDTEDYDLLSELIPLAICTDPSVVRLEGELLSLGNWEEALAERGVSISWSPAGNGVWVGGPVTSLIPALPDGSGHNGTLSIWCRGYDANGDLVCSYDPIEVE